MGKPTLFIIRKEMDILRPFVIRVTREEDVLQVEYLYRTVVKGAQKDFLVLGYRLTRKFLEKRNDWKDCTQFGMHLKDYDIAYMHSCVKIIQQFVDAGLAYDDVCSAVSAHMPRFNTINRNGYLINISAASYIGKVSSVEAHALIPAYRVINWVQKLKSTKFTECCVNLAADPACTVEVTTGDRTQDICNSSEIYNDLIHKDEAIKQQVWRPKLKLTQKGFDDLDDWNYYLDKHVSYWDDLNAIAPKLALALDGPIAGMAVDWICKMLDIKDRNDANIAEVIKTLTPAQKATLANSESYFLDNKLFPAGIDLAAISRHRDTTSSKVGACSPGSTVFFQVQLIREWYGDEIHSPAEIYLECVNGYLPKTRIQLDENGRGSFKFVALGLDRGDTMKVKAGFRFMTNSAEADIEII